MELSSTLESASGRSDTVTAQVPAGAGSGGWDEYAECILSVEGALSEEAGDGDGGAVHDDSIGPFR